MITKKEIPIRQQFTPYKITKANDEFNKMEFESFNKFDYFGLIDYFRNSRFYFFDINNQDLNPIYEKYNNVDKEKTKNITPIVFFYFIVENDICLYLALYSNEIGIIYDLDLGVDLLYEIFENFFCGFCLVPLHKSDKLNLCFLMDLTDKRTNNFFFNSSSISIAFDSENLIKIVEDDILKKIDINRKSRSYSNDIRFKTMVRLIIHYVPLIRIINDDLQLSPSNMQVDTLPTFSKNDFDEIVFISQNSFESSYIYLYRRSFELYTINTMKEEFKDKFDILYEFFSKVYKKGGPRYNIPCYGAFDGRSYRGYESPKGFLYKFICNGKMTDIDSDDWDNTTKSLNIYRLLISVIGYHEFGYYHRNVKPDHVFLDNENRAYFGGIATICELYNTRNESIGSELYSSPEQYKRNISSPLSDVYSFGAVVKYILSGGDFRKNNISSSNDEKTSYLLKECLNENPDSRPDSLVLFIQMHEKGLFLPKTNLTLIDKLFNSTFEYFLTTAFTGGKYLSKWSEALESSQFKNLIIKCLPTSFILKFAYTEMEANLNQALNGNFFLIDYEKLDIFQVNFLAEQLKNKELIEKTDNMIELISKPSQIINKIILNGNLRNIADADEIDILDQLLNEHIDEFAKYYDECIVIASDFYLNPEFILNFIIKEKNIQMDDAHNTVLYILQIGTSNIEIDVALEIIQYFKTISNSDIINLDLMFQTQRFTEMFKTKNQSKSFDSINDNTFLIEEIGKKLEDAKQKIEEITQKMDDEEQKDAYSFEEFFNVLKNIEDDQKKIKLFSEEFKKQQNNK